MKLKRLSELFDIKYGNQFDFNKMEPSEKSDINFISRSSQNMWIIAQVEVHNNTKPFDPGLITVTLWGTYLLSSFLQQKPFYTAQNIKVLSAKKEMTEIEKLFYCFCITSNRFKYTSHWREANTTLDDILVPETIPTEWRNLSIDTLKRDKVTNFNLGFETNKWEYFNLWEKTWIFKITLGKPVHNSNIDEESIQTNKNGIPYVTRTTSNNWVEFFVNWDDFKDQINEWWCITVGAEWFKAFYQKWVFINWNKVNILRHEKLNKYNALFITSILNIELSKKFNYWRWATKDRLKNLIIKLPSKNWTPDREFMENYIKALPYSASL